MLFEHFPELYKPGLKKTHQKQWDRFLGAFADLCIWVHCSRAKHKHNRGIVLFPGWWCKHLLNHHRWYFNVQAELEPYIWTDGHYDYKRGLSREWYVSPEFKTRSASFISDPRFKAEPKWRKVIEEVIAPTLAEKPLINRSFIQLPHLCVSLPKLDSIENDLILTSYATQLCNGLQLHYVEANTGRLHHPLQNIKKENRAKLFTGWWSYDIVACAPTILRQLYCQLEPLEALPMIDNFISKRAEIRKLIAEQTGIPEITIKRALTGMFFGLTVPSTRQVNWDVKSTSALDAYKFAIINTFGPEITNALLENELFYSIVNECQLKIMRRISQELRESWCTVTDAGFELTNAAGGVKQLARWSSRQAVAHTYFGYERQVIDAVSLYLEKVGLSFLLIHDGWVCNEQVNETELKQFIFNETGFDLDVECEKLLSS